MGSQIGCRTGQTARVSVVNNCKWHDHVALPFKSNEKDVENQPGESQLWSSSADGFSGCLELSAFIVASMQFKCCTLFRKLQCVPWGTICVILVFMKDGLKFPKLFFNVCWLLFPHIPDQHQLKHDLIVSFFQCGSVCTCHSEFYLSQRDIIFADFIFYVKIGNMVLIVFCHISTSISTKLCPLVLPHGTFNQHSCSAERPSMEEMQHPKGCCMELGNWPIRVQLGSTNSKGLHVLF